MSVQRDISSSSCVVTHNCTVPYKVQSSLHLIYFCDELIVSPDNFQDAIRYFKKYNSAHVRVKSYLIICLMLLKLTNNISFKTIQQLHNRKTNLSTTTTLLMSEF